MSWFDDLKAIIAEAEQAAVKKGGVRPLIEPVVNLGLSNLRHTQNAMDESANVGKELGGLGRYEAQRYLQGLPGEQYIPGVGATETARAYEQGYNGYTGGRAVWERAQAGRPAIERGVLDFLNPLDPINLATEISGSKAVTGLAEKGAAITEAARGVEGATGMGTLGRAMQVPGLAKDLINAPGELIYGGLSKGLSATVGRGLKATGLSELAPISFLNRTTKDTATAYSNLGELLKAKESNSLPLNLATDHIAPKTPWLHANIYRDPAFTADNDAAGAAFAELKAKYGAAFSARSPESMGISMGPSGQVVLDPEDIPKFSLVAADLLKSYDMNVDPTATYKALRRVSVGAQQVRDQLVEQFPDLKKFSDQELDPVYAAVFDEMFKNHPELGKFAPEYSTRHGFVKGGEAIDIMAGKTGARDVLRGSQQSPGVLQHAEAIGAGVSQMAREGGTKESFRPGGDLYSAIVKGGRIEPPPAFTQLLEDGNATGPGGLRYGKRTPDGQFISARDLTKAEFKKQFGVDIPEDEFTQIWAGAVQAHYEGMLRAAQSVDVPIVAVAKTYLKNKGLDADSIEQMARTRMDWKTGQPKRYVRQGKKWVEVKPGDERYAEAVPKNLPDSNKRGVTGGPGTAADIFERDPYAWENTDLRLDAMRHGRVQPGYTAANAHILENEPGMLLPNASSLMHAIASGAELPVGTTTAEDWYRAAAEEMWKATGNLDDAILLSNLTAATSAGTRVGENAKNALGAFALYKSGEDAALRAEFGWTKEAVDELEHVTKFLKGQGVADAIDTTVRRVIDEHRGRVESGINTQKETSYSGSFNVELTKKDLQTAYAHDPELLKQIESAYDDTIAFFTIDRHQSRLLGQGISPTPMDYMIGQFTGREASRALGMLPNRGQAGGWYWSKGLQSFSRTRVGDDIAVAIAGILDHMGVAHMPPGPEKTHAIARAVFNTVESAVAGAEHVKPYGGINAIPNAVRTLGVADADNIAKQVAKQVADKTFAGGTFKVRDGQLIDLAPKEGYAVAIAGTPMMDPNPAAVEKGVREALTKFAPLVDDPNINVGLYAGDDGKVSLDFSVLVPDRTLAERIAKGADQESVADLAAIARDDWDNAFIPTGGSGTSPHDTPQKAIAYLHSMLGTHSVGNRLRAPSLDIISNVLGVDTSAYGPYLMAKMQPIVDMYEKGGKKLLDRLSPHAEVLERAAKSKVKIDPERVTPVPSLSPEEARKAELRAADDREFGSQARDEYHSLLSAPDNKQLYDNHLSDGRSYGRALQEFEKEAQLDGDALRAAGLKYNPADNLETKLALVKDNPTLEKIVKKWDKRGMDPLNADPRHMALAQFEQALAKDMGIEPQKMTKYRLFRQAWAEQTLFTPRYHLGNLLGAWIANIADGGGIEANPVQYWRGIQSAAGGLGNKIDPVMLKGTEVANRWGVDELGLRQIRRGHPNLGMEDVTKGKSAIGTIAAKIGGPKLGALVGKPFHASQVLANGIEVAVRDSIFADEMDAAMERGMPSFFAEIQDMAQKQGLHIDIPNIINTEGRITPYSVKDSLLKAGFAEGYAERAGRNYAELRSAATKHSFGVVDKRQFSYDKTKLDEMVAHVMPFHYWASRATRFYAEAALTHPMFIVQYARLRQGMDELYNDPGTSARAKGFLKIMDGPAGFSILMNPDTLIGVVKAFDLDGSYTPDGETELGRILRLGKQRGIGLMPWFEAAFNYVGAEGDTYEPDPLGIRHKALVGSVIQMARANGLLPGAGPTDAPYQSMQGSMRAGISKWAAEWLPGAAYVPQKASADGTQSRATLDSIIASRIMESNPGITNQHMMELIADPDSPEYKAAYKDAAKAGLIAQLLSFSVPFSTKVKDNARDVRARGQGAIRDAAKAAGVQPEAFRPGPEDIAFRAQYKQQTGKDFSPHDFNHRAFEQELVSATPEARPLIVQNNEYHAIGSPEGRRLLDKYEQITRGDWTPPGAPAVLDPASRQLVADAWLSKTDTTGAVDEVRAYRQTYLQTHPELQEFKKWQGMMFNLQAQYGPAGFSVYRQNVVKNNPNFAKYLQKQLDFIRRDNPTISEEELANRLDAITISISAWYAATGKAKSVYDTPRTAGSPPYDPATQAIAAGVQSAPRPYNPFQKQSWSEVLRSYR